MDKQEIIWPILLGAVVSLIVVYYIISSAVSAGTREQKELMKIQIDLLKKLVDQKQGIASGE